MKKALCALTIIICIPLSGCGGSVWANYGPVEELRPVETVGYDRVDGKTELTVSAPGLADGGALLCARGETLDAAEAELRRWAGREELFFPPVRYALMSRDSEAADVEELFRWFTHSGRSRLDLPLLILENDNPRQLMESAGDITAALDGLEKNGGQPVTLLDVMAQLRRTGAALCPTVASAPVDGHAPGAPEEARTALSAGCAVLRQGSATLFLTEQESLGAALLGQKAGTVTLDLPGGSARVTPLWSAARWEGSTLHVTLIYAARLPQSPGVSRAEAETAINAGLAAAMEAALARATALEADFLHLTDDGVLPAGAAWKILVRGRVLPPAGGEAAA